MTDINLLDLFNSVSSTLNKNKEVLNAEDSYNHNHGDNMAETFSVITRAMKEKANLPAWQQLAYASELLKSKTQSGSGALYARGLAAASTQFKGKKVNETNIVNLIQTMMAAGVKPKPLPVEKSSGGSNLLGTLASLLGSSGGSNLLGSLLGSLGGGSTKKSGGGFNLGSLLGGLTGGGSKQQSGGGFDLGSLLGGLTGEQQQSSPLGILGGFVSGSPLGQTNTRAASGMLVANTLIQGAKKLLNKKSTKSTTKKSPAKKKSTTTKKTAKKSTTKKTKKKTAKKK